MSRALLAGSLLNEIAGGLLRYPDFKVIIWNPVRVEIGDVASGKVTDAPLDLTQYVESVEIEENVGFESPENLSPTRASITFRKNIPIGKFRPGWIEDGVIVRILEGDKRVAEADWIPVFTGTFRGRPGENTGMRSDLSEGLSANAFGREERYISSPPITTEAFPAETDLGEIAYNIAWKYMGLGQDEILFGILGFKTKHVTNQIADLQPLEALYQCMFPVGKKPKFDSLGRLCAIDVDLDKPSVRIYSGGDYMIESLVASPNDIEVNNQVILHGLDYKMTRVIQNPQVLNTVDLTTGFFDSSVKRSVYYSADHSQKAQDTYLVARHGIKWSKAGWTETDEFHGEIGIDTHFLRNVRAIIFGTYLALELAIATIDFAVQQSNGVIGDFLAILRYALKVASQLALAALLWSMNYIGRGEYEAWGSPFEYVFQELVSDCRLTGLDPEELRAYDYRNDFISSMEDLDAIGRERLRRELLKNQLYDISILADPLIEVDDVIETEDGSRYYVTTVRKTLRRGDKATMSLTAWKVFEDVVANARREQAEEDALAAAESASEGYGSGYGEFYGDQL